MLELYLLSLLLHLSDDKIFVFLIFLAKATYHDIMHMYVENNYPISNTIQASNKFQVVGI